MNPLIQRSPADHVLAVVLDAMVPGAPGWDQSLPPDDHPAAAVWSALAGELSDALRMGPEGLTDAQRATIVDAASGPMIAGDWVILADELSNALRMGPGGLNDAQRARILDAASRPVVFGTGPWTMPAPARRTGIGSWWKWTAAAGIAATLAVIASRHTRVENGIDAAAWSARFTPPVRAVSSYQVRMLPGDAFGSRYLPGGQSNRLPVNSGGDWSAVGSGGGFQPVALANMAEFVPMPAANETIALAELMRADRLPGEPWTASLINHFSYDYPAPAAGELVSLFVEAGPCPWQPVNRLVHIGLRASSDPKLTPGRHGLVACDVRMLVDFNPRRVAAYRLVSHGPAIRTGKGEQVVAAGTDLLADQLVTAIYEIVPAGITPAQGDGGSWLNPGGSAAASSGGDILAAKVVFRQPGGTIDRERSVVLGDAPHPGSGPSADFQFSAAVAAFGLLREQAPGMRQFGMDDALALARAGVGTDPDGQRGEFIQLLAGQTP